MSSDFDREQLVTIFVAEASDDMARFWKALHPTDKPSPEPADLADYHTVGHKLKGAALLYGFPGLGKLGALLEETLERVQEIPADRWPDFVALLREVVASFRTQVDTIGGGGSDDPPAADVFVQRCAELMTAEPSCQSVGAEPAPADDYLIPTLDAEVLSYFAPEAEEYLDTIRTLLQRLESNLRDPELIQQLYRVSHTLKGSAYTVGFQVIGDVAHPVETCMIAVREGRATVGAHWIPCMHQAVQVIRALMHRDQALLPQLRRDVPETRRALRALEEGLAPATAQAPVAAVSAAAAPAQAAVAASPSVSEVLPASPNAETLTEEYLIPNLDPEVISYFAPEAQEYLEQLEAHLLRLEKEASNPEIIHQVFRTAHTLKGSAYTVGFQAICDLTHHIEDFMVAVRD